MPGDDVWGLYRSSHQLPTMQHTCRRASDTPSAHATPAIHMHHVGCWLMCFCVLRPLRTRCVDFVSKQLLPRPSSPLLVGSTIHEVLPVCGPCLKPSAGHCGQSTLCRNAADCNVWQHSCGTHAYGCCAWGRLLPCICLCWCVVACIVSYGPGSFRFLLVHCWRAWPALTL
jgi:hypothetical protein